MKKRGLLLVLTLVFTATTLPLFSFGRSDSFTNAFIDVAKKATPSVVFIKAEMGGQGHPYGMTEDDPYEQFHDEFFRRFFGGKGRAPRGARPGAMSQGSGFIISSDGYVMTNYHVVKGAGKVTVMLHRSHKHREVEAEVIGGDPQTDVAILKMKNEENISYPYLKFADSNAVEVGQWVCAIGNPFALEATVTKGIISAKGRQDLDIVDLEDFMQTDATIYPGNSGGPMLNLDGEVIGINTAVAAPNGVYTAIGFIVPSNIANSVKAQLLSADGKITRGYIGITLQPIDEELKDAFNLTSTEGALVSDVLPNSPAAKAGLKQGDVITKINGKVVRSPRFLQSEILLTSPGNTVSLTVNRSGALKNLSVTIGTYSDIHGDHATQTEELGLSVDNLTPDNIATYHLSKSDTGVVVTQVERGSVIARAGIRPGALIIAVNRVKVSNVREFNDAMSKSGDRVLLLVRQQGMVKFFSIKR